MENSLLTLYNSELNCNFVSKIRAVMKVSRDLLLMKWKDRKWWL